MIKYTPSLKVFNLEQTPVFDMVLNMKTSTALKKIWLTRHLQKEALKYQMKDGHEQKNIKVTNKTMG